MISFLGNLVAASMVFAGAMGLMAVGLLLGRQPIQRGCGDPRDCECGAAERRGTTNQDDGSASK